MVLPFENKLKGFSLSLFFCQTLEKLADKQREQGKPKSRFALLQIHLMPYKYRAIFTSRIGVTQTTFFDLPTIQPFLISETIRVVANRTAFQIPTILHLHPPPAVSSQYYYHCAMVIFLIHPPLAPTSVIQDAK